MTLALPTRAGVLRSLTFRRQPIGPNPMRLGAVLAGVVVLMMTILVEHALWAGQWREYSPQGVTSQFAIVGLYMFVIGLSLILFIRRDRRAGYAATLLWASSLLNLCCYLLAVATGMPDTVFETLNAGINLYVLASVTWSFAYAGQMVAARGAVGTVIMHVVFTVGVACFFPYESVFYHEEALAGDEAYTYVDVEELYLSQPALMAQQIDALRAGDPDVIDVFALTVGGTAYQRVFQRETQSVVDLFSERYDAGERTMRLLNSEADPVAYPLANNHNLELALTAIAEKMGPDDLAFVFLTSHGSHDLFSLDFWDAGTTDLEATQFASMLARSGIRNAMIVVSSCYSGSFVDDIAAPDRMIVTAASADTTSFGCSDDNDWTWWGRAFFDEALRSNRDPRAAFWAATALVAEWEAEAGYPESRPQMDVGSEFEARLDAYLAQAARHSAFR